jgi:hypothetical protein
MRIGQRARACDHSSNLMKISHIATVALLAASAMSSVGAIGPVAHQYRVQRSAVQVVANTTIVERMQGLSEALDYIPESGRHSLLTEIGFSSQKDFAAALSAKRQELELSQQARAEELTTNDKRLTVLLAACGFSAIVALLSAIALYDIVAIQRRRPSDIRARNVTPATAA